MHDNIPQIPIVHEQLLRLSDVKKLTGLGGNTIYTLIRSNQFPRQLKITANGRASAWLLSEINTWLAGRIVERDANKGGV